jgi:hypothetical protein
MVAAGGGDGAELRVQAVIIGKWAAMSYHYSTTPRYIINTVYHRWVKGPSMFYHQSINRSLCHAYVREQFLV